MRILGYFVAASLGLGCRAESGLRVERIGNDKAEPFAIVGGDVLADNGTQVERLRSDGTVRWRSNARGMWARAHGGPASIFVVAKSESVDKAPLLEVELPTGLSKTRCWVWPHVTSGAWFQVGNALVVSSGGGTIERIDPDAGVDLWSEPADGTPLDRHTQNEFWVSGANKVRAFAIADGSMREMDSGMWASITPDGRTLVTDFGADIAAFDTQSLQRTWTYKGQPNTVIGSVATSDRWIAVLVVSKTSGGGQTVRILQRADGKPVWSHRSKTDQFLGYVAAGGDLVAYYDSKDTSLHAVHLPDGKTGAVYRFDSGLAIGTERVGIAPAVPEKPPLIDGDIMIVYDAPIRRAYRVRPRN